MALLTRRRPSPARAGRRRRRDRRTAAPAHAASAERPPAPAPGTRTDQPPPPTRQARIAPPPRPRKIDPLVTTDPARLSEQHDNPVGQYQCFVDVVRNEQHRWPINAPDAEQMLLQGEPGECIKRAERF